MRHWKLFASLSLFFACGAYGAAAESPKLCHVGVYRLDDGRAFEVNRAGDDALRWRMLDGTSGLLKLGADGMWDNSAGWTERADGKRARFDDCAAGSLEFDGHKGTRVPLVIQDVTFDSGGVELAGRLVMPPGNDKVPVVVLVHGSEDSSARDLYSQQRLFPAMGVGAFVYDKRGTGASKGSYTHDYPLLAADAAAAANEARRLAGPRAGRVGFHGTSQGGWVGPLAATLAKVDFVIVSYGLAVSPSEENRECIELDMTRHGFGAPEIRKALEVAHAAELVANSNFQNNYELLDEMRAKYSGEPWYKYVRGNITHIVYEMPPAELRVKGPQFFAGGMPYYDPMPVLRRLDTPQLWILGADDIDAPSAETTRRLRDLQRDGKPIDVVVYPGAEHGMYEFVTDEKGERLSTRQPRTYLPLMAEYAKKGKIGARYDKAAVYRH